MLTVLTHEPIRFQQSPIGKQHAAGRQAGEQAPWVVSLRFSSFSNHAPLLTADRPSGSWCPVAFVYEPVNFEMPRTFVIEWHFVAVGFQAFFHMEGILVFNYIVRREWQLRNATISAFQS